MEEFTGQLGERAIGVTSLMAKTLGITTAQLFKQMQDGKLKPEDMFKLADAMSKFAHSSQGYQEALNNSASAQERMKNAWKLLAYTILESGLDEVLAGVFQGLSDLMKVMTPLIKHLVAAAKGFIAMYKAINAVNLVIPIFIALTAALWWPIIRMVGALVAVTFQIGGMTAVMALLTRGLVAMRVAVLAAGQALLRFWPFLLLYGLIEAWSAFDAHLKGEANWMNFLVGELMIVVAEIDLFIMKIQYLWELMKNAPRLGFQGIVQDFDKVLGDQNVARSPNNGFYAWNNQTQREAGQIWERQHWYNNFIPTPTFTPQQMTNELGMGKWPFLNIVIKDEKTGKKTHVPVDLRTGKVVTIPIGGADTK